MPKLAVVKAANAATELSYTPVGIFVGATSGIGQGVVEALARQTNGDAHIIISGRNKAAADSIISKLPHSPNSTYEFLPCDATLLSNVDTAVRTLTTSNQSRDLPPLKKLNYLFLAPGALSLLRGRDETAEGIDRVLATSFYARWRFVQDLLPLLQAAKDAGEDARVISVLAAGNGGAVDLQDLGLVKTYTSVRALFTSPTYNSMMCEEYSTRYPGISFTHIYPGFIDTPIFTAHWLGKIFYPIFLRPFSTSVQDCAQWMLHVLFDPSFKSGAFHLSNHADTVPLAKLCITEEGQKKVYDHLLESFAHTEAVAKSATP